MNTFEVDPVLDHVDDPTVREVYADGLRFVSCSDGGVMTLELTVQRHYLVPPATAKVRTHTAVRLVVPMATGLHLGQQIHANLEQHRARLAATGQGAPQPKH